MTGSVVHEYLISQRLINMGTTLSQYHILPHSAHTLLAQASLCVLLTLDGQVNKESIKNFSLTKYAGWYWIDHAIFGNVSSRLLPYMAGLDTSHVINDVNIEQINGVLNVGTSQS
jgi:hypothetical protein